MRAPDSAPLNWKSSRFHEKFEQTVTTESHIMINDEVELEGGILQSVETDEKENGVKRGLRKMARLGKRVWKRVEERVKDMRLKLKGMGKDGEDDISDEGEGGNEKVERKEWECPEELTSWERLRYERMKLKAKHEEEKAKWEGEKASGKREKREWEHDMGHAGWKLYWQDREDLARWEREEKVGRRARTV